MEKESNRFREARKKLGLTQGELAKRLGVSKNYVWMLEAGKKPMSDQIKIKLDSLLGLTVQAQNVTNNGGTQAIGNTVSVSASSEERLRRMETALAGLQKLAESSATDIAIIKKLLASGGGKGSE